MTKGYLNLMAFATYILYKKDYSNNESFGSQTGHHNLQVEGINAITENFVSKTVQVWYYMHIVYKFCDITSLFHH